VLLSANSTAAAACARWGARRGAARARLREVRKVLEAGVQVRLLAQRAHVAEVAVVQVRVDAEQALEHRARDRPEVRREGLAVLLREHARVIHLHGPASLHGMQLKRVDVELVEARPQPPMLETR